MRIGEDLGSAGWRRLGTALRTHRLMVAGVTLSALLASVAFVELTPARYRSEARLLVDTAPASAMVSASDLVSSQMQVLRSREIARRVIERNGLGAALAHEAASPAGFGLAEARAASVLDDAVLEQWFANLSLERDGQSPVVRIGFEARDPAVAARIANSVAETFIELQTQGLQAVNLAHGPARLVARAMPASEPSFPQPVPTITLSTLFALLAAVGAALVQARSVEDQRPLPRPFETRLPQSLPAAEPPVAAASTPAHPVQDGPDAMEELAQRILRSSHGDDTVQIVVTSALGSSEQVALDLGRMLSHDHPTILIDLVSQPMGEAGDPPGLDALLLGVATFDEAIRLDRASRLHVLTCGMQEAASGTGLDIILQALAHTYAYVVLLAPALSESSTASDLATKAQVTVLTCPDGASDPASAEAWRSLKGAGVRTIHAYSGDQTWIGLGGAGGAALSFQPRSIHLMSGMMGSTQASPAAT
jgi:capsular polysaccharide biosynthesis protein